MPTWAALVRRLRALLARPSVEREMDEELRLHLELQTRELERRGLRPDEARRSAVQAFGGMDQVKESYRDARGVRPVENLVQDTRYSIRTLVRQRVFAATAIATFAIGLGATAAILTLVDTAWLGWSSAYRDADRLTMLFKVFRQGGAGLTSPFDFRDWQRSSRSFEHLAAYMRTEGRMTTANEPAAVNVVASTSTFFSVLGVRPVLGRFYSKDEEVWGRNGVAVLAYRTWQTDFGGEASVIGRKITLDGAPVEVVGVAPPGTWYDSDPPHVYVPLAFAPSDARNTRNSHFIFAIGRLRSGVSLEQARSDMRGVAARIAAANVDNLGTSADVQSLEEVVLGDIKPTLRMLMAAALLLLVIACANVTNLMLVRSAVRLREMSVRSALGASTRRILQQLWTESTILAAVGGAVGLVLAVLILHLVGRALPAGLPRVAETGLRLDWRVVGALLAAVLGCATVCGMLPGIELARRTRRGAADALREGSRGVAGGRRAALGRGTLVVAQLTIGTMLLVVSGLLARSLMQLQRQDSGVAAPDRAMSVFLALPQRVTLDSTAAVRFFDAVLQRVKEIPGVTSAGVSSHLPLAGGGEAKPFWVEGREPATNAELARVVGRMEAAGSLRAMGGTLVRGRWFQESDRGGAPLVAVISEGVARQFFKDQDPIGQRISLHRPERLQSTNLPPGGRRPRWTVVGVVKDIRYASPREEPESAVYVHYPQGQSVWSWGPRWLVARTLGDPSALATPLRDALREVDPTLPLSAMLPLDDRMALSLRAPRFTAALVTTFAIVAVLLAAVGLYGVVAYSVTQETRSFGVRIALGATTAHVTRHVLARGLRMAIIGIAAGIAGAFAATALVEAQLFRVARLDPVTYAVTVATLLALTLLASYAPARRAGRADPLLALRAE